MTELNGSSRRSVVVTPEWLCALCRTRSMTAKTHVS